MSDKIEADTILPTTEETVGTLLMRALYEEIVNLRTPWAITPQSQQQEVIDRLRTQVESAVRVAVRGIATGGFSHVGVSIESMTLKDEAKVVLTMSRHSREMHELADRVGSSALIVFADPVEFTAGMHVIQAQADQLDILGDEEAA